MTSFDANQTYNMTSFKGSWNKAIALVQDSHQPTPETKEEVRTEIRSEGVGETDGGMHEGLTAGLNQSLGITEHGREERAEAQSGVAVVGEKLEIREADPSRPSPGPDDNTAVDDTSPIKGRWRKVALTGVLCVAQLVEIFVSNGSLLGYPSISKSLNISFSEISWIFNAYQIACAPSLLVSGRMCDIYGPKHVFIGGMLITSIATGVCAGAPNKIVLYCFRALTGFGSALTLTSAISNIAHAFPDKKDQSMAIACFSSVGFVGACLSQTLNGLIVMWTWRAMYGLVSGLSLIMVPVSLWILPQPRLKADVRRKIDLMGILLLMSCLVTFIYGVTRGATIDHWTSPSVLVPLCLAPGLLPAFLWWETKIEEEDALIPPSVWKLPNFRILTIISLVLWGWYNIHEFIFMVLWQAVYGYSPEEVGLRYLPLGIGALLAGIFAIWRPSFFRPRYYLVPALLIAAGTLGIMAIADRQSKYWSHIVPSITIGAAVMTSLFICCNVALVQSVETERVGMATSVFNASTQVGGALIVSTGSAIASALRESHPAPSYVPYRWALAFVAMFMTVVGALTLLFYREPKPLVDGVAEEEVHAEVVVKNAVLWTLT